MARTMDMTKGNILKLVISFALPLLLANFGQQLYMMVDASIVGRGIGVKALAAVGSSDWIYWLILWSLMGMTQGFSFFVSRYFGRRDYGLMNRVIANSVFLCFVIGMFFTIAGILAARPLLRFLGTPEDILADATIYLVTMIGGTLVVTAYNMSASILRAFGNGRGPLIAIVIAGITNVILDLLFVLVFHMGVFGAAIASVVAQFLSFLYCLGQIRQIEQVEIKKEYWKPDRGLCMKMLRFSLPLALQYIVIAGSGIVLQSTINSQGSIFVAGFTATNKLYGLLEITAMSYGMAFSTFFSQNYGAGNYKRVKEGVSKGLVLAVVLAVLVSGVIIISGRYLLQIFIDIKMSGGMETLEVAYRYLFMMAIFMIIIYPIYIYKPALQSIGVSMWSMYSGVAESIMRILMAKVVFIWIGTTALFLAEPVCWVGSLVFTAFPYYYYQKQRLSGGKKSRGDGA